MLIKTTLPNAIVTQKMLDAGICMLDKYDSTIHEMATTYNAFVTNRDNAEKILCDVWWAMTRVWLDNDTTKYDLTQDEIEKARIGQAEDLSSGVD
jgi:hypothetical protein